MYMCTHAHSCTSLASLPLYWWILKLWQIQTAAFLFIIFFWKQKERSVCAYSGFERSLQLPLHYTSIPSPAFKLCVSYSAFPSCSKEWRAPNISKRSSLYSRLHVEIGKEKAVFSQERKSNIITDIVCASLLLLSSTYPGHEVIPKDFGHSKHRATKPCHWHLEVLPRLRKTILFSHSSGKLFQLFWYGGIRNKHDGVSESVIMHCFYGAAKLLRIWWFDFVQ